MTLTEGPPQNAGPGGMGTTERAYIPISFQTLLFFNTKWFSSTPIYLYFEGLFFPRFRPLYTYYLNCPSVKKSFCNSMKSGQVSTINLPFINGQTGKEISDITMK